MPDQDEQPRYVSTIADDEDGWPELRIWEHDGLEHLAAMGFTHERQLRIWMPYREDLYPQGQLTFEALLAAIRLKGNQGLFEKASPEDKAEFVNRARAVLEAAP